MVYSSHSPDGTHRSLRLELSWQSLVDRGLDLITRIRRWVSSGVRPKKMGDSDNQNKKQRQYENIGPTAALVAYYRASSDIPFAKEIAQEINAEEISKELKVNDPLLLSKIFVAFEARFKSVDAVLGKYPNITRFIEIPSGFSTRGITKTQNPAVSYVECDLPLILQEKQKLVGRILAHTDGARNRSLFFHAASILDGDQLHCAADQLSDGPIAIITEGLLSYLTIQERTAAAKNVWALLAAHGGVWIVTDLTRMFRPDDAKAAELRQRISTTTGFSPITGCFPKNSEAKRFFNLLGFKVHDYRRSEVMDTLSASKSSGLSDNEVRSFLEPQATFALEARL